MVGIKTLENLLFERKATAKEKSRKISRLCMSLKDAKKLQI
jgi:hypothetical protein